MKHIKHYGKCWLAMVLSLVMCVGLLSTTAFAANWNPGDKITINVRVYDESTGAVYNVGTDSVEKGDPELIQSVRYQIPALTKFVSASQFGRVTKVVGNWYFPAGDSQPTAYVEWSCNADSVTMTYWVNWYKTGSGSGSGSDQDTTVNIGSSGSRIWTQYIVYHSNYPDGNSYSYKVTYNIQSYTATYNDWGCIKSLSDVKFSTPNGYEAKSPIWNTNQDGTGTGYAPGGQFTFQQADNGKTLHLYAQWQPTGGTEVTPVTLTYMDGTTVYGTRDYFAGDTATAILCTTEKAGYTFAGWDTDSSAQTVKYKAGIEFIINSNMTLYAVWEKDSSGPEATDCITVNKVFSGLTIDEFPWDFSIEYTAVNTKEPEYSTTKTLTMDNADDFDETTMTVTWLAPHYSKTGGSTVTIKENCDVDGYTYTTTTTKGTVDDSTHTVSMSFVNASTKGTVTLTNTYTPSSVTPVNPKLTGIEKERMTSVPSELALTGINTDTPVNLKVGEQATLLYAITVTGDEGANYTITDPTATPVDPSAMTGTIGSSGKATVYVTKTIDIDDVVEGYIENIAYVEAGNSTDPIPGTNPGNTTPSEPVRTQVRGEMISDKTRNDPVDNIVNYTIDATNMTGITKGFLVITDIMDEGLSIVKDENGNPIYTLTFVSKDGIKYEPVSCIADVKGQTVTWEIDVAFAQGDHFELSYEANVTTPDEDKYLNNDYTIEAWNLEPSAATYMNELGSDVEDNWVSIGSGRCSLWIPGTSDQVEG